MTVHWAKLLGDALWLSQVRVTVADCEASIARGDVEGALKRLRRVPVASPHYTRAR